MFKEASIEIDLFDEPFLNLGLISYFLKDL